MYKPNALETYRRKNALTIRELSTKLEIKYHTCFRYCDGSRNPKRVFAKQIQDVTGIPMKTWGHKDEV